MMRSFKNIILTGLFILIFSMTAMAVTGSVTFHANGGSGEMEQFLVVSEADSVLPPNEFTRDGYVFVNWNTSSDGSGVSITDKGTISLTDGQEIQLYAQWKTKTDTFTITYDPNGGTAEAEMKDTCHYGEQVTLRSEGVKKEGFIFNGWNTKAAGDGTPYQAGAAVNSLPGIETGGITLYAQWIDGSVTTRNIEVSVKWDDDNDYDNQRPNEWFVTLKGSDGKSYSKNVSGTSYIFTNLPTLLDGSVITYTATVTEPYDYSVSGSSTRTVTGDTVSFVFTHYQETKDITVSGTFEDDDDREGKRPDTVKLKLKGSNGRTYTEEVDVDGDATYSYDFTGLPGKKGNKNITYKLTVNSLSKYDTKVKKDGNDFDVTHTYKGREGVIRVSTVWQDNSNYLGIRPVSYQINLNGDGKTYTRTLTASNNYYTEYGEMPLKNGSSTINYTIRTESIQGYEASVSGSPSSGFTITQKLVSTNVKNSANTNQSKQEDYSKLPTEVRPITDGSSPIDGSKASDQSTGPQAETKSQEQTQEQEQSQGEVITLSGNDARTGTAGSLGGEPDTNEETEESEAAEEAAPGTINIRVVWRNSDKLTRPESVSGKAIGSKDDVIPFSIPQQQSGSWLKLDSKGDQNYKVEMDPVPGHTTEVAVSSGEQQFFTITCVGDGTGESASSSGIAIESQPQVYSSTGTSVSGSGNSGSQRSGEIMNAPPSTSGSTGKTKGISLSTESSKLADSNHHDDEAEEIAAHRQYLKDHPEAEYVITAAEADDKRLVAKESPKMTIAFIGITALMLIVGISAALLGFRKH